MLGTMKITEGIIMVDTDIYSNFVKNTDGQILRMLLECNMK